jgi:nicotinate-nucleotide pyrophosphorylase (carboxylating)
MTKPDYLTDRAIREFITTALNEDIGEGDHSTQGSIDTAMEAEAQLNVKDRGIIAGIELAEKIFHQFDSRLKINVYKKDGDPVGLNDVAFVVQGPARSILTTERVVLNCLQRMSGIATRTRHLCDLLTGTKAIVLDTRKTTPNFRLPEKWAVLIGGGQNHRFALYDGIMIKDNHIDLAGGIRPALERIQEYKRKTGKYIPIEIETRNLDEVREVLKIGGVDVIMLDNMRGPELREAVRLIGGRFKTEASGGVTELNIAAVAACGVDFISVGALTHTVKTLDLSLKVIK